MLKINDLCYSVVENGQEKKILKNINLSFEDNKIYAITGHNGSGKSTLLKIIMGIVLPNNGSIVYENKEISTLSITERAKLGFSYAFQQPVTYKGLKVRDLLNIASGEQQNLAAMCDVLSKVGLCAKDYIDRNVDEKLSGGELKRIELASVLARKSKVNLFDEPEAGIDLWSFENLTSLFENLKGKTNIIVSHQKRILEIADEIIVLNNGEIVLQGERQKVLPMLSIKTCGRLREGQNG